MTIATAARERAPAPIASAVPRQAPAAGIMAAGLPASLLVFAWAMGFDRRLVWHDRYAALAATLAFIALAAPLFRRGLLGRTLVAVVHLGTLLLVIASADRALAAWEERRRIRARVYLRLELPQRAGLSHGGRAGPLAPRPSGRGSRGRSLDGETCRAAPSSLLACLGRVAPATRSSSRGCRGSRCTGSHGVRGAGAVRRPAGTLCGA